MMPFDLEERPELLLPELCPARVPEVVVASAVAVTGTTVEPVLVAVIVWPPDSVVYSVTTARVTLPVLTEGVTMTVATGVVWTELPVTEP